MEMSEARVSLICGSCPGRADAAIGQGLRALSEGKTVTWIRFLRGRAEERLKELLEKLEPELKAFSFEKYEGLFGALSEEKKLEAINDIRNGVGFAKKVMATRSCDLLILDEILELTGAGALTAEELKRLAEACPCGMELVMTGETFPEELRETAQCISHVESSCGI